MTDLKELKHSRASISKESINRITLMLFAPILILVGVAGFLIPDQAALTSGAVSYNIFHIVFGFIGITLLLKDEWWAVSFNLVFGLIDLYQALASYIHLFPERFFQWTKVDDVLHIAVGATLITIGCYGVMKRHQTDEETSMAI